ncbi:MAG: DUF2807 domain-containing protein [Ferruginibacter sp.]|nr:DUF2807 domain-containing protein [Ferruginibacter sp.]
MKANMQRLRQTINTLMITLVFPSLLSLFSFTPGPGTKAPGLALIQKQVKVENAFQMVKIDGDISVVLTNEPVGRLMVEGKERDVNRIRFTVKNNKLIIDAQRKTSFDALTIYLPATGLQAILVNGDTDISSAGIIKVDDLHISLNGLSSVRVTTTGKLSFDTPYEYELLWGSLLMEK